MEYKSFAAIHAEIVASKDACDDGDSSLVWLAAVFCVALFVGELVASTGILDVVVPCGLTVGQCLMVAVLLPLVGVAATEVIDSFRS